MPKPGERVERGAQFVTSVDKLLDVGCGDGMLSYFIKDKVKEIYGIDNDKKILRLAEKLGYKIKVVDLDKERFPFSSTTFDVVTSFDVIEHVYDPMKMLREAYRVLKKGGTIILSTPNVRFSNHVIKLIIKGEFPKTTTVKEPYDGGHIHFFTYNDIETLLREVGFQNIRHKSIINKPKRGWKGRALEAFLGEKLMREFRSQGILTLATK